MEGEVVLVTGSSGCLGHQVVKMLIGRDDKVCEIRCLDLREPVDLMRRQILEENEKFSRLNEKQAKKIVSVQGDIRDINLVERLMRGVDCVIHCAASIDLYNENEDKNVEELESINVTGTEILLKSCIRFACPKFIHVSSFEVYSGVETIYYATENTLPTPKWLLFGPSAWTKSEAENKVKQFSNNKLKGVRGRSQSKSKSNERQRAETDGDNKMDSLNAIIVRFPTIYGEFDRHYVSKIIEITKFFGGKLRRMDNIWIRQQPIYVGNAAWSLLKAKQRMDSDQSISGEEFHITDETAIGDPFDFVQPFLECKGMGVTKRSWPFLPIWILLLMFFALKRSLKTLDFLGIFTSKTSRLQEAIQKDAQAMGNAKQTTCYNPSIKQQTRKHWYDYITPQTLSYMCNSSFLNRTKASLRLDYEPIITPEEAMNASLDWYKYHLVI